MDASSTGTGVTTSGVTSVAGEIGILAVVLADSLPQPDKQIEKAINHNLKSYIRSNSIISVRTYRPIVNNRAA